MHFPVNKGIKTSSQIKYTSNTDFSSTKSRTIHDQKVFKRRQENKRKMKRRVYDEQQGSKHALIQHDVYHFIKTKYQLSQH